MAWNGSNHVRRDAATGDKAAKPARASSSAAPRQKSRGHGLIASLVVIIGGILAAYFLIGRNEAKPKAPAAPQEKPKALEAVKANISAAEEATEKAKVAKIKAELNDKVAPFVKKANTNNVVIIGPKPLDPKDPDNALRTKFAQDIAGLVAIEPGDPLPPIPFYFMFEDDAIEAAAESDEKVVVVDNGNKDFLDSLKKWQLTAKPTDSEERLAWKEKLLQAQDEALTAIDEGVSVNDSIRAAYEFRKKAYETRSMMIEAFHETLDENSTAAETSAMLKQVNKKLADQGIKQITAEEVGLEEEGE